MSQPITFKICPPPPCKREFFKHQSTQLTAAGLQWIKTLRCVVENIPELPYRYPCSIHVDLYIQAAYMADYIPILLYVIKHTYMVGLDKNMVDFSVGLIRQSDTKDNKVVFTIKRRLDFVHAEER